MIEIITFLNYCILIFFIFSAIIYTTILVGSLSGIVEFFQRTKETNIYSLLPEKLPPVTIITAIYNEEKFVIQNILSSLNSDYKNLYILLVNDGSTDKTLEILIKQFEMIEQPYHFQPKIPSSKPRALYISKIHPHLMLIDKPNSGVGDSLNVALNICFTPYFVTIDADSIIHEKAVSEMLYEILAYPYAVAVGGGVYILNACAVKNGQVVDSRMPHKLVPALQSLEYMRSHLFNRTGWNHFGATMSYSGTATLLKLEEVLNIKGYDRHNFAQDTEIILRLHYHLHREKKTYAILFNPSATVWTDVPATLREFGIQRDRWQRGILRSVIRYWRMFLNPRFGIQGLFSYPTYVLLEAVAPLVECLAYVTVTAAYLLGILNTTSAILYILLAWGFTSYLTFSNMLMNIITFNRYRKINDIVWMVFLVFIEMFGFRQYHTLVKVWGTFHYYFNRLRGKSL
ncbi:glycosyl transferase family protein (plasmid) [Legionella adelaidensis]|uniref:Glycosyl transferase family protein n=1 Tax=Legionella adelaidensis TaxID=45056 RepID=A0A0W0R5J9_9GAMM|nr:glycosyltransferase [Legionella adelaidensis]KTC66309.1 glycosyl transferase family protein [Legionella adelaidensis]VEH84905.1 glycosyl transferase family protein [Legionella adelaidensis]